MISDPNIICVGCPGKLTGDCETCTNAERIREWEEHDSGGCDGDREDD